MQFFNTKVHKGFTLVEIMVVVAIISMMIGIISAGISQARENTREKKRVSDLANIEFALTLYREKERDYPNFPTGVEIEPELELGSVVQEFMGNSYTDPSISESGGAFAYWYDSDFTCTEPGQVVIFARTMEQSKNANFDELCTDTGAGGETADSGSFIVVLQQ